MPKHLSRLVCPFTATQIMNMYIDGTNIVHKNKSGIHLDLYGELPDNSEWIDGTASIVAKSNTTYSIEVKLESVHGGRPVRWYLPFSLKGSMKRHRRKRS
jgi:hypothetical protein